MEKVEIDNAALNLATIFKKLKFIVWKNGQFICDRRFNNHNINLNIDRNQDDKE